MKIYTFTKDMIYKNQSKKIWSIIFGVKILIVSLIILTIYYANKVTVIEREVRVSINKQKEFSQSNLREYLIKINIKYPDIVFIQSQLETGNFSSKVFKENSNLFGMRQATSRPTTSQQQEGGYAFYDTWQESVVDYAFYQSKYLSTLSREQYIEYLGKYYAEDPSYSKKLNELLTK